MKKLLWTLLAVFAFLGVGLSTAYASDCLDIEFDNWDSLCLDIEKNGSKFDVSVANNNLRRNSSILCYITLPNNIRKTLNACRWSFSYDSSSTDTVIVSAMYQPNDDYIYSERFSTKINFRNGSWVDSRTLMNYDNSRNWKNSKSSSSSSYNDGDLELSTNKSSPSTNQYVNLTVETDRDYYGKLTLSAKYRSSSNGSRSSISNTSSTYFSSYSDEWEDGYYKMKSSDKGKKTLSNLLKFKKSGYYRIYVKDTDWNESYIQFNVDTSSSSSRYDNDDLKVSVSPSSPDTNEWVKLTIETDDDHTGKINFSKFQYRSSSSSSWSNIYRTSSTYVSDYSDEWDDGYYKMTYSDDGEKSFSKFIKFKKAGYYRIYVEDTDWNESYVQVNVDTSSSSSSYNDDIELSTNRKSPSTSQYVNLTIETDEDYVGRLSLSAKYRKSSSDSWSSISNTSTTYFTDYSDEWENGFYRMTSDDDGEVTLGDLVKFKKSGYYRIYVKDYDGNESYIQFDVNTAGWSNDNNELKLSVSPSYADTYEWIDLTVKTDADYDARIKISKLQYRSSSSSSWSNISNITSSTYVSDYSDAWSDSFHRIVTDEDGKATLRDIVKFKKAGYYRIYVEDTDDNESYVQVSVDTSSSSSSYNDDIELSTNRKSPSTNQYVNLTIETDEDYVGNLSFYAKYRSSSSSSWTTIPKSSRTSSTYFSDYSDEWEDGYYKMRSSDDGEVTLKDLVKFRKSGYYRIYVEDTDGNESYIEFSVDTSSSSSSYNDDIELSTNRKSPSTNQYVNLTIETDRNYYGKLYFTTKYRSSSNGSRSNISNTSSTYFSDYSDEWEDGYYRMTSSDRWEVTLSNLVKFRKEGYYRISVLDTDWNESYIEFTVGDADDNSSSSVKWFTSKELSRVKSLYRSWDNTISQLKKEYPSLKKDSYWIELSEDFYDNMKDVVNDRSSREFRDYDDFEAAFNKWYKYTYRNR